METQEIFDKAATHLFTQGHRSIIGSACAYRAPNGDECAVGVFIPNGAYVPIMEFKRAAELIRVFGFALPSFMARNVPLLTALQEVHDDLKSWRSSAEMRMNLKLVAERFALDDGILAYLKFSREKADGAEWDRTVVEPQNRQLCDVP
jgi:hypothetical protein